MSRSVQFSEAGVQSRKRTPAVRACRACGCTEDNCSVCIMRTGQPCHWVEWDLCSACVSNRQTRTLRQPARTPALVTFGCELEVEIAVGAGNTRRVVKAFFGEEHHVRHRARHITNLVRIIKATRLSEAEFIARHGDPRRARR